MPNQRTDASIAFSVTDNLSQSIVGMKNSVNSFKKDAVELQKQLDMLDKTRFQLKNFDLKRAQQELQRTEKAMEELGDAAAEADRQAARADFEQASQNYENVRRQLNLVSQQARQTEKDINDMTGAISRSSNRAGSAGGSGGQSLGAALGKAGIGQMASEAAQQLANAFAGSALGDAGGTLASSGLSGAISGASIGSMIAPGAGTAIGAAAGTLLGLLQGATQNYEAEDDAFKAYYRGLYEAGESAREESLTAGTATASQRELDAIAFNKLLGEGAGDEYLADLRTLAAETPLEYSDLTGMSRALATGFGDSPERMLELMQAIGDAGSAVGVTASDMTMMAQAMSRMQGSGKATLEYLNILQERGVNVIGMLADEYGKTQGQIYDMISKGEIDGRKAVDIIQAGMEGDTYRGAMETMAQTFSGLTSTLEDTMTELDNARGEGYADGRKAGLTAEIDAYGGALGDAMKLLNRASGENEAFMENLSEQYKREALSAVLTGGETTLFDEEFRSELADLRQQYGEASREYIEGNQQAGLQMESLARQAEALAAMAYENSEEYALMRETEDELIAALRENTAALSQGYLFDYEREQNLSKGRMSTLDYGAALSTGMGIGSAGAASMGLHEYSRDRAASPDGTLGQVWSASMGMNEYGKHAAGLRRVPYDGYAAILHEGERVLTAREARTQDNAAGGAVSINISGQWSVRSDADVDRIAETIVRKIELAQRAGVRQF